MRQGGRDINPVTEATRESIYPTILRSPSMSTHSASLLLPLLLLPSALPSIHLMPHPGFTQLERVESAGR